LLKGFFKKEGFLKDLRRRRTLRKKTKRRIIPTIRRITPGNSE